MRKIQKGRAEATLKSLKDRRHERKRKRDALAQDEKYQSCKRVVFQNSDSTRVNLRKKKEYRRI